ncbi:hypothetical protein JOB18_026044 [Solea senegalensis]|uniref:Uncharacterized protein n=1 Tax=Solea senegalensis TaxID=28829 RepID=A0AAV6SUJ0_SOLSE|nr:hypothetical protein JOB18_026044 [Solea senegalensis]
MTGPKLLITDHFHAQDMKQKAAVYKRSASQTLRLSTFEVRKENRGSPRCIVKKSLVTVWKIDDANERPARQLKTIVTRTTGLLE